MAKARSERHEHGAPQQALGFALGLTLAFAAVEVVTGFLSGSLALLADAGHMLVDSAGLGLALAAALIARRPSDSRRSYGYARAEVLAIPLHVALMLAITGYIVYSAIGRIGDHPDIQAVPVLVAGTIGLVINLIVMRMLHPHVEGNLNARAARLEVIADAAGSVGVIASGLIIAATGWTTVDVIVSLAIGVLVVPRAVSLLRQALSILLESTPPGMDVGRMEQDATAIPGVVALHDLHVWSLAPSFVALSAHVEMERMEGCERPMAALATLFREQYGIGHVTLQPETRELHAAIACCEFPDKRAEQHVHVVS